MGEGAADDGVPRSVRRRARKRAGTRSRTRAAVITVAVLALVTLGAVYGLLRLDVSRDTSSGRAKPPPTVAPSSTTRAPTTTTTIRPVIEYVVRQGETLSGIAKRFDVTTAAIVFANRLASADRLTVGQRLLIPPPPTVRLVVKPARISPGSSARLVLMGAQPAEQVKFEIISPAGAFTGPAHIASANGRVTATYSTALGDPNGTYQVIAHGDHGTTAQATLRVGSASP